jgi:hypothetical protein
MRATLPLRSYRLHEFDVHLAGRTGRDNRVRARPSNNDRAIRLYGNDLAARTRREASLGEQQHHLVIFLHNLADTHHAHRSECNGGERDSSGLVGDVGRSGDRVAVRTGARVTEQRYQMLLCLIGHIIAPPISLMMHRSPRDPYNI